MGKKVLVVDDSQTVRQQVGLALRQPGFDVLEASDGMEALELLRKHADCALVVCDVNMPKMNGLEMLEAMRQEAALQAIPVVMLTTEGQPQLIARAKAAGAKGWMVKPFKTEQLVAVAKKLTS
jgi:two-component system chemotaxis response regulator CheY